MNQKSCFQSLFLAVFAGIGLFVVSCETKDRESRLASDFSKLDAFLRRGAFRYDSMKFHVARIERELAHSQQKTLHYDVWNTTVDYKWNADSSVTLLKAYKTFRKGFSREVIIHSGDSILFVHRFSTEPLGLDNRTDFTFLESVYYLTETGTIKHLQRIDYREQDLRDTLAFRDKPFADLTDDISHYYALELAHSKNILTLH